MQSSSNKRPIGKALLWVGSLVIVGVLVYLHDRGVGRSVPQSGTSNPAAHTPASFTPGPLTPAQEKAWEDSVAHPAETLELHAVQRTASDVYIGTDKDGKQYRLQQPDPDDAYECGVIPPNELPNITRDSQQWKGAPVDIPTIRQQANKPILLERFKPIDGNAFWTLAQGTAECDVEVMLPGQQEGQSMREQP